MAPLPQSKNKTRDAIYAAYAARQGDSRRDHLGASLIGRECSRQIWYTFRWARTLNHDGRLLRLFDTGHMEEPRMVSDLRAIGCEVIEFDPDTGRQWTVRDETGHFGGSMDGIALGVPEAPKTWHVCEFKTHGEKSFKALEKDGVEKSKPEHFAQMQVYMSLGSLTRALYLAKNKNTDELYCERVRLDEAAAMRILEKARRIIEAPTPLERMSDDPSFYKCRWCDFHGICHMGEQPERNCRTCLHSTPAGEGKWECAQGNDGVTSDPRAHHPCHRYIPDLVPLRQIDVDGTAIVYDGWIDNGE